MKRQKVLMIILILFAVLNTAKWGLHFIGSEYHPLDFRTYYTGASVYGQDRNPYSDFQNELHWSKNKSSAHGWQGVLGFPHATVVYAPQFVWYFLAYAAFDFQTAMWLQFALNLLSLAGIVWLITALNRQIKPLMAALAVLAFRGTWYALDNGQPMIQVLAICLFALYLLKDKKQKILPGILFGLVAFKFTLLLPFLLFLLIEKQHKTLLICILTAAVLNTAALAMHPEGLQLVSQWQWNMERLWAYPHQYGNLNAIAVISSAVSVPIAILSHIPLPLLKGLMLLLLALSFLLPMLRKQEKGPYFTLAFAALSSLCFGQHLIYDLLALIGFRLLYARADEKPSGIEWLLMAALLLPLGSLAEHTGLILLHLSIPLLLFLYWFSLLRTYFPSK